MKLQVTLLSLLFLILHSATAQRPPAGEPLIDEVRLDVGIVSKLAATLAATLANKEAKRKADVEPFSPSSATAVFRGDRWEWQATVGYGKGDMVAIVSFAQDGSEQKVDVKLLVNERTPINPK
ncbi:MAG: hypothetical protein M3463_16930 [Verrucomicrobiota bacterium]|nr:hypothetical protein [Verrucomicrobiota bacterium]